MIDTNTVPAYTVACRGGMWQQYLITAPADMLMDVHEALRALARGGAATVDGAVLLRVRATLGVVPEAEGVRA